MLPFCRENDEARDGPRDGARDGGRDGDKEAECYVCSVSLKAGDVSLQYKHYSFLKVSLATLPASMLMVRIVVMQKITRLSFIGRKQSTHNAQRDLAV